MYFYANLSLGFRLKCDSKPNNTLFIPKVIKSLLFSILHLKASLSFLISISREINLYRAEGKITDTCFFRLKPRSIQSERF